MKMKTAGLRGRAFTLGMTALVASALVGSLHGCKQSDSLIVLAVRASDSSVTNLRTLVISAGGTTQVFQLQTPISTTATSVGLYVPGSLTGNQTVTAQATGTQCGPGYEGSTTVQISGSGVTANGAILMSPTTTCPPNNGSGGTKGTGGTTGTGGTGGVGGPPPACASNAQPPAGTPPALTCCAEYDQDTPELCSASAYAGTEVDSATFSPDGATFVTAARVQTSSTAMGEVVVWSFDGHKLTKQRTLTSDGWFGLSYSPDGTKLAVAVRMGVDVWNTSNWTVMPLVGSSNLFYGARFTPDGKQIIAVDSGTSAGSIYVFDLTSTTPTVPIAVQPLSGQPSSLAVGGKTVSGQLGVAVSYQTGDMDIFSYGNGAFSTPTNVIVDSFGYTTWNPAFSADGTLIAAGDTSSQIHTWAFPPTGAELGTPITFSTADSGDQIFGLAFAPNGGTLAAGGADSFTFVDDAQIALFSVTSRTKTASAPLSNSPSSVAYSPLGNVVAGGEIDCGRIFLCTN
jgi:hypothetical protein